MYLEGLVIVAVLVAIYWFVVRAPAASDSGAQISMVTPPPPPVLTPTNTGTVPPKVLFQTGTGDASVPGVLYPEKSFGGTPQALMPGMQVTFCQQRGGEKTWLFQSMTVNPGTIVEINSNTISSRFYRGIGFLVSPANISDLTSLTTVYPSLKGTTFNVVADGWNWAMTGPSLFDNSTSSLDMDYTMTVVDSATAVADAQSAYLDCGIMASAYGYTGDRKILTCALPDPIGTLSLGSVPTVKTARQYVTPGLI